MAITKTRKDELVAHYVELLNRSSAVFVAEYKGMSVKQVEALRTKVIEAGGALHVTKNTLLGVALEQTGHPVPEALLTGQLATGFVFDDLPAMAKLFSEHKKEVDKFVLRGGVMGQEILSAENVEALSKLPSLDQLRAQLIGMINSPAQSLVSAVANGVRQVINVLDAYAKKESEPTPDAAG